MIYKDYGDYQVDVAYIPFVERFQIVFSEVFKHDITAGRPKLAAWIEVFYFLWVN